MKPKEVNTTSSRPTATILIVAFVTAALSSAAYAQTTQQILRILDADNDGVINQSEAQDEMR